MKTKNNVQKAVLRSAAVIVSFVLISFTVSAQGFWKQLLVNSSFDEIAQAMVTTKTETSAISLEAADMETEQETTLELENWMIDNNTFAVPTFQFEIEADAALNLENWMLDENVFHVNETEAELELEAWMTDKKVWNI